MYWRHFSILINILLFTTFTWYCLEECTNKKDAAYISVIPLFTVLLVIILYHIYVYTTAFSKIKQTKPVSKLKVLLTAVTKDQKKEVNLPPDDGLHDLLDFIDDPINTMDHEKSVMQVELMATCTCSVVDHEALASPDAEETKTQNVPVATDSEIENEV